MEFLPLRRVALPEATAKEYGRWAGELDDRLSDDGVDRSALTREVLTQLYYPAYASADPAELSPALRMALLQNGSAQRHPRARVLRGDRH